MNPVPVKRLPSRVSPPIRIGLRCGGLMLAVIASTLGALADSSPSSARAVALVDPPRNLAKSREAIRRDNQAYNAFLVEVPDAEQAIADGLNIGSTLPLAGVTVAVKSNIDLASSPAHAGAKISGRRYSGVDADVVRALKSNGALVVGVTNMDTWARGTSTISEVGGSTGNAWDSSRSPFGSSGGSAVAVARGMVDVALGTDTCGSIRYPAAANGVFGLRPTHGSVSLGGVVPLSPSQDVVGPLAASVDDLRRVFDVIRRFGVSSASSRVASNRIGVMRAYGLVNSELLKSLDGMTVISVSLPATSANVINDEFPSARALWRVGPNWSEAFAANPPATSAYSARLAQQRALKAQLTAILERQNLDAIVYATSSRPPGRRGTKQSPGNCWISANSGLPALAVPGPIVNGFPAMGVDVLGRANDEESLFAIAERMRPGRVPLADGS